MESPYYEMTHDIEEENRIANLSYARGYLDGYEAQAKKISEQFHEIVRLNTIIENYKTMLNKQEVKDV